MAEYIKCDKCGSEGFIRVFAIPKGRGDVPQLEERRIICHKCKDELTAEEVRKALSPK